VFLHLQISLKVVGMKNEKYESIWDQEAHHPHQILE
jgi:hypothetical protein